MSSTSRTQPLATTSTSTTSAPDESRPQAGPLPSKLPPLDRSPAASGNLGSPADHAEHSITTLNDGPHPAENRSNWPQTTNNANFFDAPPPPRTVSSHGSTLATIHPSKYALLFSLRSPQPNPKLGGLTGPTALRICLILAAIGGTVLGWALSYQTLRSSEDLLLGSAGGSREMSRTSYIFLHIAFGSAAVILLVLLQRAAFQARDERYAWKHPGQVHPRLRHGAGRGLQRNESISRIAPWNRPPLPSYSNAVGHRGTGDVEDEVIARPPPPAYGNVRGSTLLLSGVRLFRSESRRSRATSISSNQRHSGRLSNSIASILSGPPSGRRTTFDIPEREREVDLEAGVLNDIRRARKLEETLAKLEDDGKTSISLPKLPSPAVDPSRPSGSRI